MRFLLSILIVALTAAPIAAQSAPKRYAAAMAREQQVRTAQPSLRAIRLLIADYEAIVRRYPSSGYSDNALWQAAGLAQLAYEKYGQETDRRTAVRMLEQLRASYPDATLATQVPARLAALTRKPADRAVSAPAQPATAVQRAVLETPVPADVPPAPVSAPAPSLVRLTSVSRSALPNGERITIALDSEPQYHEERLLSPERLFFDFRNTMAADGSKPSLERLTGGVVRDLRLGPRPEQTTRLVIELEPSTRHRVFALYNPYRLVVDLERDTTPAGTPIVNNSESPVSGPTISLPAPPPPAPERQRTTTPVQRKTETPSITSSVPDSPNAMRDMGAPVQPSANSNGSYSLARQLGLGVARIVIDAGHGGHDPGALGHNTTEAEITLDIALRLEKLLLKQPGTEVVLTRRTDVFVPLEERTAIANRQDADLFLSVHVNVGRNPAARGIETYFLNFASNPEAEAVAARENAGSGMAMHNLPDLVRKIALNNKLDESRDLAHAVQSSLYRRVRQQNAQARDRGVKQAPFVVLVGAQMPSVLAEVSFLTNKQEGSLLKTAAYRQRIAQALFDAVVKYRQSLKKVGAIASRSETR